jgi:hypothetical protein
VNGRQSVQRSQPKIMREVKRKKKKEKKETQQGGTLRSLVFPPWSNLFPLFLHPVLKRPPPASSKRKVKSFLLGTE